MSECKKARKQCDVWCSFKRKRNSWSFKSSFELSSFNFLSLCRSESWCMVNSRGLSYPREVIGNVWKFLTVVVQLPSYSRRALIERVEKRKWWKINCGFKKSISANHCNKSRFSLSCKSFLLGGEKKRKNATNVDDDGEIQFRSKFISVLMDVFEHWSIWWNLHECKA